MAKNRSLAGFDAPEENAPLPPSLRRTRVLIIAVDDYQNGIPDLNNPVLDAETFATVITENYQIDRQNVRFLLNEKATLDNIIAAFEKEIEVLTEEDNFIFWFSGHGELYAPTGRGYWIPHDGRPGKRGSWLPNDTIKSYLSSIKAHHIFGIADACFSGTLFRKMPGDNRETIKRLDSYPSRYLLTSGRAVIVPDGPKGSHSPFARTLFNHLKNNTENALPVSALTHNIMLSPSLSGSDAVPHGSHLAMNNSERGEFIFYKKGYIPDITTATDKKISTEFSRTTDSSTTSANAIADINKTDKPIPEKFSEIIMHLKNLVAEGGTDRVFDFFAERVNPDRSIHNDLLLLKSRHNRLLREKRKGLISEAPYSVSLNRIEQSVLSYLDDLEEEDLI